jgi:hypothetical protein
MGVTGQLWKTGQQAKSVEKWESVGYCSHVAMRVRQTRAAQFRPIFSFSVRLSAGVCYVV